jgi:NADP-dependent 3-hydroxy acid dehydrogenase YdfG
MPKTPDYFHDKTIIIITGAGGGIGRVKEKPLFMDGY